MMDINPIKRVTKCFPFTLIASDNFWLVTLIHLASPLYSSITYFNFKPKAVNTTQLNESEHLLTLRCLDAGKLVLCPELRPLSILFFPAKSPILSQFQNLDNLIAKVILGHSRELRNLVYTASPVQSTRQDGA
jgi:hypothetical protein